MQYRNHYHSPIGTITLLSDGIYLTKVCFETIKNIESEDKDLPIFEQAKKWFDLYFHQKQPSFTPPLKINVRSFQHEIYQFILTIPFGKTMTYGEVAKQIAQKRGIKKMSPQAIGKALSKNPILIIIPCHRIIGANQQLIGYAGGIDKKLELLKNEGILFE